MGSAKRYYSQYFYSIANKNKEPTCDKRERPYRLIHLSNSKKRGLYHLAQLTVFVIDMSRVSMERAEDIANGLGKTVLFSIFLFYQTKIKSQLVANANDHTV
jgi:hypothetical protein